MLNERQDEFAGWTGKLEEPGALSGPRLADKEASWEKLHARLRPGQTRSRKRAFPWPWLSAAAVLIIMVSVTLFHSTPTLPTPGNITPIPTASYPEVSRIIPNSPVRQNQHSLSPDRPSTGIPHPENPSTASSAQASHWTTTFPLPGGRPATPSSAPFVPGTPLADRSLPAFSPQTSSTATATLSAETLRPGSRIAARPGHTAVQPSPIPPGAPSPATTIGHLQPDNTPPGAATSSASTATAYPPSSRWAESSSASSPQSPSTATATSRVDPLPAAPLAGAASSSAPPKKELRIVSINEITDTLPSLPPSLAHKQHKSHPFIISFGSGPIRPAMATHNNTPKTNPSFSLSFQNP